LFCVLDRSRAIGEPKLLLRFATTRIELVAVREPVGVVVPDHHAPFTLNKDLELNDEEQHLAGGGGYAESQPSGCLIIENLDELLLAHSTGLHTECSARPQVAPDAGSLGAFRHERLLEWSRVPIVVLSARWQDKDKVAAFDAGADDCARATGEDELRPALRFGLRQRQDRPTERR
jgi:hypothetical protein